MPTLRQKILTLLSAHPEGLTDKEIAKALGLPASNPVNAQTRSLHKAKIITREPAGPKGNLVNALSPEEPQIVLSPSKTPEIWEALTLLENAARQEPLKVIEFSLRYFGAKVSVNLLAEFQGKTEDPDSEA